MDCAGAEDIAGKKGHACLEGHREGGLVIANEMNNTTGTEGPVLPLRSRAVAPRCAGLTLLKHLTIG